MLDNEQRDPSVRASLELLYDIGREFAAALDLRTVLHRVLFLSMKNVGAVSGSIIVLDDHNQPLETAFLIVGQQQDHTDLQLRVTYERGLAGWVARNQQAVLLADTSRDERWLRRPDDAQERTGAKSAISVPILARDKLVGVITLVHPQVGFFVHEHLSLVQAIADQAGVAVVNARLYAESQRQVRVMTAAAESMSVITASLRLDDVLQRILDQIGHALQSECASLALVEAGNDGLEFKASTRRDQPGFVGLRLSFDQDIAGWVAQNGEGILISDTSKDERYLPEIDQRVGFERHSVLCAPIRSQGQVIGVIEVDNSLSDGFGPEDLLFLTGIGGVAGTAIRNARLFENLQAAHQRYRELFEDSIDWIFITDLDGKIVQANRRAQQTIGLDADVLQIWNICTLHDVDIEKVGMGFEKLTVDETIVYESNLYPQMGTSIAIQVYVRPVQIDDNTHLQWIMRDITEHKNLDKLRDDLIAMVYHDLRSPLANIASSLDVLASMLPLEEDDALKSLLNIAIRSSDRIQRLTNSLLDISRLEAGQPLGNRQPAAPQILIQDALDMVLAVAGGKDIEILVNIQPELPLVFADTDMMRRVLINLMENAIKFTPAEGKIYVGAQQEGEFVQFWVRDTGPGISPADQERIFDKFTRLETKSGPRGFGLGLAFCRLAIGGHGGEIWVESEPGSGSAFKFTLPLAGGDDADLAQIP